MCLDSFWKASKRNNLMSKSRVLHSKEAAYIHNRSKNELCY